jgi:serine protease Do
MKFKDLSYQSKVIICGIFLVTAFSAGYYFKPTTLVNEVYANTNSESKSVARQMQTQNGLPDFSNIVSEEGPAVVNISVTGFKKAISSPFNEFSNDPNDPFNEFFKRFQPNLPESGVPIQGQGSGFIVKSNGVILTNAHVVTDADEVTVRLNDKREFKAKVVGLDKVSDVAVVKIDAHNLPTVRVGDSQKSRVGEWVLAIGSPFGFENSATAGVISAKSRSLPDENYVPFIQTDVAINPGNSGGPLFNINGEVIGINSQIYSQSGGYQGLSFAIPIEVALKVESQLVNHGKVSRGRLGLGIQSISQDLAESFGMDKTYGALVSEVEKDSPAEKAGIKIGDVILKFNGFNIESSQDLPPLVADEMPGTYVKIQIWRDKKAQIVVAKIGEAKNNQNVDSQEKPTKSKFGLMVRPLSEEEKNQANLTNGLLVEDVLEGSAAKSGIRSGDIILSVNGKQINNLDDLNTLVEKSTKVALLVKRGESKLFVAIANE